MLTLALTLGERVTQRLKVNDVRPPLCQTPQASKRRERAEGERQRSAVSFPLPRLASPSYLG